MSPLGMVSENLRVTSVVEVVNVSEVIGSALNSSVEALPLLSVSR